MTPEQIKLRGKLGSTIRNRPDDIETANRLRRELKASMLADHIKKTVDSAPPLTADQLDKLSLLLRRSDAA